MRRVIVFNNTTVDGYFVDMKGDMSWAHNADPEFLSFVQGNASSGGGELLFGRITYEMMAGYWPTPMAVKNDPIVAKGMNEMPKIVFSRTLDTVSWNNTRLLKGDPAAEVRKLKKAPGGDIVIMGSGSIVSRLAQEGLIDEYQFVIVPVALGKGRTQFDGMNEKLPLKLVSSRVFKNGNVFLCYQPKG
ncbi:MAG: dihydrofolate reductase family protein [Spirochaetia bacterium]|jgi:dihydrofolate reductase